MRSADVIDFTTELEERDCAVAVNEPSSVEASENPAQYTELEDVGLGLVGWDDWDCTREVVGAISGLISTQHWSGLQIRLAL